MEIWLASAHVRANNNHPELDGKIACPYSLPGRGDQHLSAWLKGSAPDHVKDYCREGLKWTKNYPGHALPGFTRLARELS